MAFKQPKQQKKIVLLEEGWALDLEKNDLIKKFVETRDYSSQKTIISRSEYIQVYTTAYDMCTQPEPYDYTEKLYDLYCDYYKNYLSNDVLPQLEKIIDLKIIDSIVQRYDNHLIMNRWTSEFFLYLDRFYTRSKRGIKSLDEICYGSFYDFIFIPLISKISSSFLNQIKVLRDAFIDDSRSSRLNSVEKEDMKKVFSLMTKLFFDMGSTYYYCNDYKNLNPDCLFLYKEHIQKHFLESSEKFYCNMSDLNSSEMDIETYLTKFELLYDFEVEDILPLMENSVSQEHKQLILKSFFDLKIDVLLNNPKTSVSELFNKNDDKSWEILSKLHYWLNKSVDRQGYVKMSLIYKQYLSKTIQESINILFEEPIKQQNKELSDPEPKKVDKDIDSKMLVIVYDFYKKFKGYCSKFFDSSNEFVLVLNQVMKDIFNNESYNLVKNLASYLDKLLKKKDNNISDDHYEDYLKELIFFLEFITVKDVFAEYYRSFLAKRLLNRSSISDDYEKIIISEMKIMNGFAFTSKLEGMIIDILQNSSLTDKFSESVLEKSGLLKPNLKKIDFQPMILSNTNWGKIDTINMKYPEEVKKWMNEFEEFYSSFNNNKKLNWLTSVGNSLVSFQLGQKTYDLQVDLLQATLLNAFAYRLSATLDELIEETGFEKDICKRVIFSLSGKQIPILIKSEDGTISINSNFRSPSRRIKLPNVPFSSEINLKKVEEDRTHIIEASIVRIMKARKTLVHQELISNVLSQLHTFQCETKDIKRHIESLIQRDYLERSSENGNVYNYLA